MSIFSSDVTSSRTSGRRSETRRRPRRKCDLQNKRLYFFNFLLSGAFHAVRRDSVFVSCCERCEREERRNKSIKGCIRESTVSSRSHITLPNQMGVRQSSRAHTHASTHTQARTIAGNSAKTKEIISPRCICSVCAPPASFSADVTVSSAALQTNTDVTIARHRQDQRTRRGAPLEIGLFRFILLKF